jgi:2-hydroxyglutaryl-CoA dehydratase D-component
MNTETQELLILCGFEADEIKQQRNRIEATFERLNLGSEDMVQAATRIKTSFDIELLGVRKALGVWLKELFDVVLARDEGKKLIYYGYPPFQYIGLVIKAASESVGDFYVGCPEVVLCQTLGQIFGKHGPILEASEMDGLPPGHAMCSLLQMKHGALAKGMIPVPDLGIATSYFCDMGPKADELMQYRFGFPVEFIDSCMDSPWGEWPGYDPQRVHYFGQQLELLFESLYDRFGIKIDEPVWKGARKLAGRLYKATSRLNHSLMADPVPLGVAEAELILNFPMGCTGIAMTDGAKAIEILAEEAEKRVAEGFGVVPKNAPRVFLGFQSLVDPMFNKLLQEVGLAVPVSMTLLPPLPKVDTLTFDTLGEKRAQVSMGGGTYHSSYGNIRNIEEGLKYTELDGVLYNYQFSCRPLTCSSKLMKEHLEKETGLPTLLLDMDIYDDRNYSTGALRTRLEAFAEMLKARKAAV